jgi:hypothetical protein
VLYMSNQIDGATWAYENDSLDILWLYGILG